MPASDVEELQSLRRAEKSFLSAADNHAGRNAQDELESLHRELALLANDSSAATRLALQLAKIKSSWSYRICAPLRVIEWMLESLNNGTLRENTHNLYERLVGRKSGKTGQYRRSGISDLEYRRWVRDYDKLNATDFAKALLWAEILSLELKISILIPSGSNNRGDLKRTIQSMISQVYPTWEIIIADSEGMADKAIFPEYEARRVRFVPVSSTSIAEISNKLIDHAKGDIIAIVWPGDVLAPHALLLVAATFSHDSEIRFVYTDEDVLDRFGNRFDPWFKPGWDPDLLMAKEYVGQLSAYDGGLLRKLGSFRIGYPGVETWDLALRISSICNASQIVRIPFVLYHRADNRSFQVKYPEESAIKMVTEHLQARSISAVAERDSASEVIRVRRRVPSPPPHVTVIIPTRDNERLLRKCLAGVLHRTHYQPFDVLIVDNDTSEVGARAYLESLKVDARVSILKCPGQFNFASMNNLAVGQARGETIAFVNNDIEVMDGGWLTEMVSIANDPTIGAVGAKLLYPNGTVQHAGVIVGMSGAADHNFRGLSRYTSGPYGLTRMIQRVSAVTAACMVIRKAIYQAVGGMDTRLAIAFNDVDLCLRIRAAGYSIIWTPYAQLYHHESATRGPLIVGSTNSFREYKETLTLLSKSNFASEDPYYNPNLSLYNSRRSLASPPRVTLPWRVVST
jgi:GT2 family glycosyltransferase